MTDEMNQYKDKKQLLGIAKKIDVKVIEDKKYFDNFCKRLFEAGDWKFNNTKEEHERIEESLRNRYFK